MREPKTEKVNIFQIQIKMVEVGYFLEGAFSDFLRIITILYGFFENMQY